MDGIREGTSFGGKEGTAEIEGNAEAVGPDDVEGCGVVVGFADVVGTRVDVGMAVGVLEGAHVGTVDGPSVGHADGPVGDSVGFLLLLISGTVIGTCEGAPVCTSKLLRRTRLFAVSVTRISPLSKDSTAIGLL